VKNHYIITQKQEIGKCFVNKNTYSNELAKNRSMSGLNSMAPNFFLTSEPYWFTRKTRSTM